MIFLNAATYIIIYTMTITTNITINNAIATTSIEEKNTFQQ